MEDRLDPLGLQESREGLRLGVGALLERCPGGERGAMPRREIVEDDDFMARRQEGLGRDRADVAGTAGDQDPCHARTIPAGAGQGSVRRIVRLIERVV